jgi:septal ring factor EnvC (AmiA/AmiB activator)
MNDTRLGILAILLSLTSIAAAGTAFYQVHIARYDFTHATQKLAEVEQRQNALESVVVTTSDKLAAAESDLRMLESTKLTTKLTLESLEKRVPYMTVAMKDVTDASTARFEKLEHKLKVLELAVEPLRFDRRPTATE